MGPGRQSSQELHLRMSHWGVLCFLSVDYWKPVVSVSLGLLEGKIVNFNKEPFSRLLQRLLRIGTVFFLYYQGNCLIGTLNCVNDTRPTLFSFFPIKLVFLSLAKKLKTISSKILDQKNIHNKFRLMKLRLTEISTHDLLCLLKSKRMLFSKEIYGIGVDGELLNAGPFSKLSEKHGLRD